MSRIRTTMLDPPLAGRGPSLGGTVRARMEDFEVVELPAYAPDGRSGHLLVLMRKRGLDTESALVELGRAIGVPRAEIGVAGLKDRHAVTTQWVSVPERSAARLAQFRHPAIELGDIAAHGHKLRRGHLRGNRFRVVVRGFEMDFASARALAELGLVRLAEDGLLNYYGPQRFGHGGRNLEQGLARLSGRGGRPRKADFIVSAGQAGLFNLALAERLGRGLIDRVLLGDVLHKRSGGMFESSEPDVDQLRLDAGELSLTGPLYGSKLRWPSAATPAEAFEREILELGAPGAAERLARLGRAVPGTRRVLKVRPEDVGVEVTPDDDGALGPGLALHFTLPAGSFATVLLRELGVAG